MYFVHFFLNKNVYASKGVDLRSVCSHITSESGKMPVNVFWWWRNCEMSGALCVTLLPDITDELSQYPINPAHSQEHSQELFQGGAQT